MTSPRGLSDTFYQEAQELLDVLEQTLLELEQSPNDAELIDTAFRALHTIKGSGAMCGFAAAAAFTHYVENAFELVRKGDAALSPPLIAVALTAKDHIRQLIEHPDAADQIKGDAILQALEKIIGLRPAALPPDATMAAPSEPDLAIWRIRFSLARDAIAMGTNPLLLLDELRALGRATITARADAVPPLEAIDPAGCYLAWDAVLTTAAPRSAIEDVFMFVIDDMRLAIDQIGIAGDDTRIGDILVKRGEVVRDAIDSAASQQLPIGQLLIKAGAVGESGVAAAIAEQTHVRAEAGMAKIPLTSASKTVSKTAESIRVPAERLDELMERVGELVITQSRLAQVAAHSNSSDVKAIAEEIERLVLALRDTTMGVRMLPIGSLFGRFRRLVHDLSHDLGKNIELVTSGEETELDKTVIERLNDPLVHLIRNAIDHGLEAPAGRSAAGKAATGQITLRARHIGAEVLVSVGDDGRGLDRARIQARAEENGLLAPGAKLPDTELFQLIFQPGFSTAQEVTSLSGRGVGMDVVKRTIEALHGKIDISSTPGGGTEIGLRLPLTLAIIDGLLIRIGTARYVLPLTAVEECVELSVEDDARSRGRSFLNIRGDLVPFLRLRELFLVAAPADRYQKVVIVSIGEARVGLVVDQVIGNHQTVIKSLSALHAGLGVFSGATILGDGTVALILDIAPLIELGLAHETTLKAAG
jgi:two-component system chemotaxis sensor kinase CheA